MPIQNDESRRTTAISEALSLAQARFATLFPAKDGSFELVSWDAPYFVPTLGLVARIALYDTTTYQGPHAELVIVPLSQIHDPTAALDALADTISALLSRGLSSVRSAPLGTTLSLSPAQYTAGMFTPDDATLHRRREALSLMEARFDAVAARMKQVYGLRLPRYLATFAAFWRSLDAIEKKGMDHLGRSPGGIMVWFEDDGLTRKTRDGLDARLECRFRCDPPELVSVMWGDSDGLHFGLWYDDPADPPTCIAHNYARDSAETWRDEEPTPLAVLLEHAREHIEGEYREEPIAVPLYAAREALAWFAEADRAALAIDPPAARWVEAPRIATLGTFGPALPPGAGTIRVGGTEERLKAWKTQPGRVRKWIDSAKRDCAEGRPAAALTFGLDLHWRDDDEHRKDALDLLVMAYEKLGRHAHAETVKVHHAHRDLQSVGVFLPPGEDG